MRRPVSPDAVVVVPGIMGSALRENGRELWGLRNLGWYGRAWLSRRSTLDGLALDADEQGGTYGRVSADSLLRVPAYAPFLQGVEPYTDLVTALRAVVAHPDAVLEFPYDWRLPVTHNATELHQKARAHLAAWRDHPEYAAMRRALPETRPGRLVLVAHSMGGLLVRAMPDDLDVRATVTLGTPFDGAVKAAAMIATGEGAPVPLPHAKLRAAARTMPGVYDLLPVYRCVDDRTGDTDPRRLTPDDVRALHGDPQQAERAFAMHRDLAGRRLPGEHVALVGVEQNTSASLSLGGRHGIEPHPHTFRLHGGEFERDAHGVLVRYLERGDGTVPLNSALPHGLRPSALPQQHGALASDPVAVAAVCEVVTGREPGTERLGSDEVGLELPDLVPAGAESRVPITGIDSPAEVTVSVTDADDRPVDQPAPHWADGGWWIDVLFPRPGVHRVSVAAAGTSAVTQLTLATEP